MIWGYRVPLFLDTPTCCATCNVPSLLLRVVSKNSESTSTASHRQASWISNSKAFNQASTPGSCPLVETGGKRWIFHLENRGKTTKMDGFIMENPIKMDDLGVPTWIFLKFSGMGPFQIATKIGGENSVV